MTPLKPIIALLTATVLVGCTSMQPPPPLPTNTASADLLAVRAHARKLDTSQAWLRVARQTFLLSGLEDDADRIESLAREGLAAARRAGADSGDDPVAAYYGAVHLGLILRRAGLKAVGRLGELEELLKVAIQKPATDDGGPLRVLGMLYVKAPPWPTGIGDLDLALEHLERATADFPHHPMGHLYYAYALKEDDCGEEARSALTAAYRALDSGNWGAFAPRWRKECDAFKAELEK